MGQPVLTATLALAIAVSSTAAIAVVTLAAKTLARAARLIGVGAVMAFAVAALQRTDLKINFTSSMPIGIYLLAPLQPNGVKRGILIAACAPIRAAQIGRQRDYLGVGPCADDTELLLKTVIAVVGDVVDVSRAGVAINGCLLPRSRPARTDRSGRPLPAWPNGRYLMGPHQVWLYASVDRSWDSRYWGPVSVADIDSEALPLLVPPGAFGSPSATGFQCTDSAELASPR